MSGVQENGAQGSGAESGPPRPVLAPAALIAAVLVVTAAVAFFISVRGEEQTQVPAIEGQNLLTAMERLQERGLIARVEGRFSSDAPAWRVIAQTPVAGSLVKAGRPVSVVVSRGRVIAEVGNYVGRDVDQVRLDLQALTVAGESPVRIGEGGPRVSDPRPAGTILAQSPPPGTPISGEITILFTVSRGPRGNLIEVPQFIGMTYAAALAELAQRNQAFVFTVRAGGGGDAPGTVVFQSPDGGSEVPHGTVLQVAMTRPEPEGQDRVFGLFEHEVERYAILVDLTLAAELPDRREPVVLLSTRYQGGPIAVPFVTHRDAQIVLTVLGREVERRTAGSMAIDAPAASVVR